MGPENAASEQADDAPGSLASAGGHRGGSAAPAEEPERSRTVGPTVPKSLLNATSYLSKPDAAKLAEAYAFAEEHHRGMLRRSGEPFINHPVAVTEILAEMNLDISALMAGLLHDTVEDTSATFEAIEERFGETVSRIVEGETKISKLAVRVYENEQAENLRQMLLAMTSDVRIILVKLADRLHNMRTLRFMPPHKQLSISEETIEIFAPLANRLGINHIKNELEDIAFRYLEPERYLQLQRQVRMRQSEREAYVKKSIKLLEERLRQEGLKFELSGRSKHLYSIHRKMLRDHRNLDQIFDLMAIRAVLDPGEGDQALPNEEAEKAVCYRALGIVHSLWTPIPGRFKDYVAVPKPNGYQSLHTTVIGLLGQPIEVQIRTRHMHEVAEFGVAAHWAYKEGVEETAEIQKRLDWMKQLLEVDTSSEDADAFVDAVKTDLLSERVLVFTPAGDVVNLPRGSTPIDFAYHVHTEIGHRCIGARVNGEIVPLNHELATGDRVEVLTNRSSQYGPSQDWLNIVVTRGAKQKIKHYFRAQARTMQLDSGRRSLERALRRRSLPVAKLTSRAKLEEVAKQLINAEGVDELLLAIDASRVSAKAVVEALVPDLVKERRPSPAAEAPKKSVSGVYVDGLDAPANLARCCSPVRGDDVIGYITRGRGISVHRVDCPNVKHLMLTEQDRFVQVTWDAPAGEVFAVDFEVLGIDRPGLLKDVLDVISGMNKSASRVAADVQGAMRARIMFRVDVKDQAEIEFIKESVGRIADVTRVYRSRPGLKA
ncbi:MAG: bifunctional (p)ppGpp synthetase/guanosine-3',5'-bis(diphosphate) 3'-pyrophosphohydrolase [Trueperaceae bacterium]|nr:bifunctional (p)ppGpp synthetase/guanosine-3',5'-bis(diphosphate) 3'-pyrophosphohydrolase [Trueperaceae bacterium]MCW5820442.1 bifunctional (p)ppGpp synthetase/guanosine-3',5'-bis(diphosphate) 3'-pyrophosphohydrolase [Trueperaceae bacterium]